MKNDQGKYIDIFHKVLLWNELSLLPIKTILQTNTDGLLQCKKRYKRKSLNTEKRRRLFRSLFKLQGTRGDSERTLGEGIPWKWTSSITHLGEENGKILRKWVSILQMFQVLKRKKAISEIPYCYLTLCSLQCDAIWSTHHLWSTHTKKCIVWN